MNKIKHLSISLALILALPSVLSAQDPITRLDEDVVIDLDRPPEETSAAAQASRSPNAPVDLNRASQEDLETLPGIGPSKAQAILALRQRLGRFQRTEDLLRVRGIGRATFRRLRPLINVGITTPTAQPAARTERRSTPARN